MEMDARTRARYEAWKRRKILKRTVTMGALSLILLVGLAFGLASCGRDSENGEYENGDSYTENTTDISYDDTTEEPEPEETEELTEIEPEETEELTEPEPTEIEREAVVFCGLANPDDAIMLSDEEALSYLALVNRCYRVSSEFEPGDLSAVDVESVNTNWGSHLLRESAARALEEMFQAAAAEGLVLLARNGHRPHERQVMFHNNAIASWGLEEARRVSAVPGHSEHQLGLAMDITAHSIDARLIEAFAETPEGIWVNQNAHRFGFIISYPYGREEDTGFIYEPWHIRFVGVEVATEMFNSGQILEEFLWYNN